MLDTDSTLAEQFTFHVTSLAHTQTTREYDNCAYTAKVRKFCDMMVSLGHKVYLYASEDNEAACHEHICCITKEEQIETCGVHSPKDILKAPFGENEPHWKLMNARIVSAILKRIQPKDFICVIAGGCNRVLQDVFKSNMVVEFGIGYSGVFSKYQVFESYTWMALVYGKYNKDNSPEFYHAVIPNYFEEETLPFTEKPADYFLYIGRRTRLKGVQIALDVCKSLGKKLVVAGNECDVVLPKEDWIVDVGIVTGQKKAEIFGNAIATFVPTLYNGPFEGVAVESMFCGTPIITTDWGIFSESNIQGVTGYRCRTMGEFAWAAQAVENGLISRSACRKHAILNYACSKVRYDYHAYFARLMTLWGAGFYDMSPPFLIPADKSFQI